MALPYVPFYENMLETADALSAEEFGELARAYIRYAFERQSYEEAVSSLSQESRLLFGILKNQADHCNRISRVRSRVAATRRRTSSVTPEQKGAKGSKKEQNADGEKKAEKENGREHEKERTKEQVKEKPKEKGERNGTTASIWKTNPANGCSANLQERKASRKRNPCFGTPCWNMRKSGFS